MTMRLKENKIGVIIDGETVYHFFFDRKTDEEDRKIALAILNKERLKIVADALMEQFKTSVGMIAKTELAKEVYIYVSHIYYPDGRYAAKDINMEFYTEFIIYKENDVEQGFYDPISLGRFNRKERKFYEISNSMLGSIGIL